jgi:hypothetical protein
VGLTTPHCKKKTCYENSKEASDLDGFLGERPRRKKIDVAEERDRWRALVNTVMNLRVP